MDTILAKDLNLVPRTHLGKLIIAVTSVTRKLMLSPGFLVHCTHAHKLTLTHTHISKI